ncbi:MAG: hypothetical protein OXP69_06180 [Spirochaetaceae bacterium]|nr:hypothetical protein [Spirochaetaceae bacterium]
MRSIIEHYLYSVAMALMPRDVSQAQVTVGGQAPGLASVVGVIHGRRHPDTWLRLDDVE